MTGKRRCSRKTKAKIIKVKVKDLAQVRHYDEVIACIVAQRNEPDEQARHPERRADEWQAPRCHGGFVQGPTDQPQTDFMHTGFLHHVCMLPWTYLVPGVPERLVHGVHDDRSSKEGPHFQLRPHLVARAHLDLGGGRKSRQTSNAHDVDVKRTNRMWSGAHLAMPRMSSFKRFASKRRSTHASAVWSASATSPPLPVAQYKREYTCKTLRGIHMTGKAHLGGLNHGLRRLSYLCMPQKRSRIGRRASERERRKKTWNRETGPK